MKNFNNMLIFNNSSWGILTRIKLLEIELEADTLYVIVI